MEAATPSLQHHVDELCERARPAGRAVAALSDQQRRDALEAAAEALEHDLAAILEANATDLVAADANGLSKAMIDRLALDAGRLEGVIADLRNVKDQPDPVGRVLEERTVAQGLRLQKVSVPIGVICIIFESRPNVTVDTAALCLRSGNACILRGGKEALHTNRALAAAFRRGLEAAGVPVDAVQLVMEQDRALLPLLLARDEAIDLVVPRGGEGLIRAVVEMSRIPVVKHDKGVCSLYVHADADFDMALELAVNAKCQRPGVCNAIENLLVDRAIAASFLPRLAAVMGEQGVELRADHAAREHIPEAVSATDADWDTEYLDLILAVAVVDDLEAAIAFTNTHSSGHSDAIVTANTVAAQTYLQQVDASSVYHNASTRFTDGAQFGLGAEVGISTNRLHARGPMGAENLCTYKFIVYGEGQARY
ncbi:MAG: glutamate-5-semialdehyde dehydrogenase [Planctomycetota bacterium]